MELIEIIKKFAESGWDMIDTPAKAWLAIRDEKDVDGAITTALINAIAQADRECGSCGCEFDPLYKRALELLLIQKAAEIIQANLETRNYCSLTLMDPDGRPMTTTITPSKAEGINWITFCTGYGTRTERIEYSKDACVCFNSPEYHIALKGSMEIITDLEVKKEMWYDGLTNHFSGPEDAGYVVLKFVADSYSLFIDWQSVRGTI